MQDSKTTPGQVLAAQKEIKNIIYRLERDTGLRCSSAALITKDATSAVSTPSIIDVELYLVAPKLYSSETR